MAAVANGQAIFEWAKLVPRYELKFNHHPAANDVHLVLVEFQIRHCLFAVELGIKAEMFHNLPFGPHGDNHVCSRSLIAAWPANGLAGKLITRYAHFATDQPGL